MADVQVPKWEGDFRILALIVHLADAVELQEKTETERLSELQNAKAALSQALLTGRVRVPMNERK